MLEPSARAILPGDPAQGPPERHRAVSADPEIVASVILPAFNEAEALPSVLAALADVLDRHHEVIVVDDASTDSTAAVAGRYPCLLLRHERNRGKGAAVRTGLLAARGRFVVIMDADNTYPAEAIPRIIAALERADLVRCARSVGAGNIPPLNRLGNMAINLALRVIHGLDGDDHLTGLYGLRREVLQRMRFTADGFDLEVEIGIKARALGLRVDTLPICYGARLGEKKLAPWRDGWHIMRRVLSLALLYNPFRIFALPGTALGALAAALAMLLALGLGDTATTRPGPAMFTLALLGALAWCQLLVFGVVAALFVGIERGMPPRPIVLSLSRRPLRQWIPSAGALLLALGLLLALTVALALPGTGDDPVPPLVLAGTLFLGGAQLIASSHFVAIFAGHLEQAGQPESQGVLAEAFQAGGATRVEAPAAPGTIQADGHEQDAPAGGLLPEPALSIELLAPPDALASD